MAQAQLWVIAACLAAGQAAGQVSPTPDPPTASQKTNVADAPEPAIATDGPMLTMAPHSEGGAIGWGGRRIVFFRCMDIFIRRMRG